MSDEAVAPDEALGFFTVYAAIPLVDAEPTSPTYDGRDTYLAWGHHADSEVHAAVRAYWDETGYPAPELQRLADVEPCWAVLAHGKDAPEDEGWYFTWDDVTWATPHAFRVTLARTERAAMPPIQGRRILPWIPLGDGPGEWCDDCDGHGHHFPWCGRDD